LSKSKRPAVEWEIFENKHPTRLGGSPAFRYFSLRCATAKTLQSGLGFWLPWLAGAAHY